MTNPLQSILDKSIVQEETGSREIGRFGQQIKGQLEEIMTLLRIPLRDETGTHSGISFQFQMNDPVSQTPSFTLSSDLPREVLLKHVRTLSNRLFEHDLMFKPCEVIPPATTGDKPAFPAANGSVYFHGGEKGATDVAAFVLSDTSPTQISNKLRGLCRELDPERYRNASPREGGNIGR